MQPFLVGWVMSIAFFLTLSVVAVISKGRSWYELACLFLLAFVFFCAAGVVCVHLFSEVKMLDFEVISLRAS